MTPRGLSHHQTHSIVHQRKHHEFFEHPVDGFALEYIETHGRFQMTEIGFNAPPGQEQIGSVLDTVALRVEQGGHQGNGFDTKAFVVHAVAQFSYRKTPGELCILLRAHPRWAGRRFEPVDDVVVLPKLSHPT